METKQIIIGVIADTHIPDKARHLNPRAIEAFKNGGVSLIIHAGDVSVPRVLHQLETVAPVYTVRGNRDWIALPNLPKRISLNIFGIPIGVTHGHGGSWDYIYDKYLYLTKGYTFEHYRSVVKKEFPNAKVIIFGHSHVPENRWIDGTLFFNPGTPRTREKNFPPSVGFLTLTSQGEVSGQILTLHR